MAALEGMIAGDAASWLANRREELNRRFERARGRFPALDSDATLLWLGEVLPGLAGPEPGNSELLSAVFDLVLLHAGRDAFARSPGLETLLRQTFPRLRPVLLQRPTTLPGALSNAVENLGARGPELAHSLAALGGTVARADELLAAGALLAWRLGEARLRTSALEAAASLPPRATLTALDLADFPDAAASPVLAALRADAWRAPRSLLSERALAGLPSATPERLAEIEHALATPAAAPLSSLGVVASIGAFAGFGGVFVAPPKVLDGGDRHRFFVVSGTANFRLDADVFGWSCAQCEDPGLGRRAPGDRRAASARSGAADLDKDGVLTVGSTRVRVPGLAGASSFTFQGGVLAATQPDSYRVRVALVRGAGL